MSDKPETFVVTEVIEKPKADPIPTRDELKGQGWTDKELDSAEKRGMIQSAPSKTVETAEKPKEDKEQNPNPAETVKSNQDPADNKADEKPKSNLPDFTFKTPEQEKVFLEAFGPGTPQRAMYFRMKNERQARQRAEQERDQERQRIKALEDQVAALGKNARLEMDEDGNPIDPEDKPLTLKQLREIQKQEQEAIEKQKKETDVMASRVVEAQTAQEEYARSVYPDFDDTVTKCQDVLKNLDTLVPERWKQAKVVQLIRQLQVAAANADKLDLDDYHASIIAYEIGQFHPDYGKKADVSQDGEHSERDGNPKDPKKASGGLTPEQMKRIEETTQRRQSSASVSGGSGKRNVAVDDVDATSLNKMSYDERQRFRKNHPEKYAQLLRA